jgi:orotate phosphoribosyltransferase
VSTMNTRIKEALVRCSALMYGDFTLASGKNSPYYIDIKKASTDPYVLEVIADEMARELELQGVRYDKIAGVVLGSIPLAVALSLRTKAPYIMVRKEKKDHGTQKMIEGQLSAGDEVLVVEDVITSAGSVAGAIDIVRAAGGRVNRVFCVVNRQEGGEQKLSDMGVKLSSLITAEEVLKR